MKAALRRFRHSLRNGSFVHGPVNRTVWTSVIFAFSFTVDRIIFILRPYLLGASIPGIEELSWPKPLPSGNVNGIELRIFGPNPRSEERRVGKECRSW